MAHLGNTIVNGALRVIGGEYVDSINTGSSLTTGALEVKGIIAGDSGSTGHGLYGGGGYHNAYNNILLHGDSSTATSGIAFMSDKVDSSGTVTNVNQPSDRAFIQYHACGITTATAEGTNPTLATSGESGRLVIGIGNDATDQVWLQTPGRTGLIHQVGNTSYVIPDTNNTTGSVGSATQPSYVEGGVIKACTYSLNKTVPADAVFTDHTYTAATAAPGKVASASAQGSSANYARQDHTHGIDLATGDSNGQVKIAGTNVSVKGLGSAAYKNESGTWAINVSGSSASCTGNAATATTATTARKVVNDTVRMATADTAYSDAGLRYYLASSSMATNKPPADGGILHLPWDTTAGWAKELYIGHGGGTATRAYLRSQNGATWGDWIPMAVFNQKTPTTGQVVVTDGTDGGVKSSGYTIATSVPSGAKFTDTDTKNTAGSTDTSSKIFLIGATSQAANPQTYSHDTAYVGTDGCLYSGGTKVLTAHQDISGKVNKSGDTMSGVLTSSFKSTTWVNSLTQSAVNLEDKAGSFGGWICGPTKNGRIAIATYQSNDDKLYLGYGERGRTTNSYAKQACWNGATGKWECDITGNAATATKATQDGSGNVITSTYLPTSGGTMTGNLNIGSGGAGGYLNGSATNGGVNSIRIGDDVWLGDCNVGGILGMKSTGANCGFKFFNSSGTDIGVLQSTAGKLQFNGSNICMASDFSGSVSAAVNATTCTISDSRITTSSTLEPFSSNSKGNVITVTKMVVTAGQVVLTFPALSDATSFKVRITN